MVEMTDRGTVLTSETRRRLRALGLLALLCACGGPPSRGEVPDVPIDATVPDDAGVPPDAGPPAPRLIAPLSMTMVTQQRPLLRWAMPFGVGAPVVELCKDRACTIPLAATTLIAANGQSAAPQAALPPGWVYWRVRATSAGQMVSSATWQFWVGRSSAANPVDTGNSVILDVNGDGHADFLVGAPRTSSETGVAHLYLGSATASATGWNGTAPAARITLRGDVSLGRFGSALASAGDVNGDGYADFLIGAPGVAPGGVTHLYLGSASPSAAAWNGRDASRRIDLSGAGSGFSVGGAGDLDGDGYADFIVGGGSRARVYFGTATPSASAWAAAATARRIDLVNPRAGDGYAAAVAGAGDVNGDGYADLLVGASSSSFDPGRAYVYLGSTAPSGPSWNEASSTSRIELIRPDGFDPGFARTLAGAGDINGDGYADFVIATQFADTGDPTAMTGAAHVYFGSALPSAAGWNGATASQRVELISPDGTEGTFGSAVAGTGDVNADGFDDFVIGNSQIGEGRGAAHVYLGGAAVDLAGWNGSLTHPSRIDLFNPDGVDARFGGSAAHVGDVNGDGFSDFVVGTFSNAFVSSATGGAANLYLGLGSAGVTSWNGVAPAMRIDLANPGGPDSAFGNSVAIVTWPARAR